MNTSISRANARQNKQPWKSLLGLVVLLLSGMGVSQRAHAQANPFTCNDGRLYLSQLNTAQTDTQLFWINRSVNPFTYPSIGPVLPQGTNGMGYNPANNFLYGLRGLAGVPGSNLYRMDALGGQTALGVVAGLPPPPTNIDIYYSGAFTNANDNILYVKDASAVSNTMYRINVLTLTATPLTLSRGVYVADFDFANGLFYGIETSTGQLVSINPTTGQVINIGTPTSGPTGPIGAFYADATGLYGVQNAGGGFYRYDAVTGARTLISGSPVSGGNDGARCPNGPALTFAADLAITKTDGNATYTPGTNVVYTIVASNNGPFGAQDARVQDALPSGISTASWTCTAANGAVCRTASGSGAIDARVDLPFNTSGAAATATFTLTMAVPTTFTGPLTNTATVAVAPGNTDPVSTNNSATDTNQSMPRVTISKVSVGGIGAFAFTGSNGVAAQTLTTTVAGTPVSGAPQVLTTVGVATTITEGVPPAGYVLTSISCLGFPGGTATPNLATRTVTLNAAATAAGANITCTFTNTLTRPALSITKTSNGPWRVGQTGATYALNISNSGTAGTTGTITVRDQLPIGIGVRPATGFSPAAGWTCTYSDEAAQSATTIVPNTGMLITCTSTTAIAAGGAAVLTLPVVVTSASPASVINYAAIGGGGDPFNGGAAPIAGSTCTDATHCTNATTSVTASPPAPATCTAGAPINLFEAAPFQGTFFTDDTTQTQTATLIATAGNYTTGTGPGGRLVVDMNWRWSPGFPLPSDPSTMTLRVNGANYATLTTQVG
ncbi:MAG: DUF11 domain-containing protein, partial [Burkholderiales bacterium]